MIGGSVGAGLSPAADRLDTDIMAIGHHRAMARRATGSRARGVPEGPARHSRTTLRVMPPGGSDTPPAIPGWPGTDNGLKGRM